jgi:Uri superfamily endonuclease
MDPIPGTYALIFSSCRQEPRPVGKLGTLPLKPGFYIYVGSAFGPGGLKGRIGHHRQSHLRPHWHMDYLSPFLKLSEIWYTYDPFQREHQWAKTIASTRGASIPLVGFGASDCRCKSHLYFFSARPSGKHHRRRIYASVKNHDRIFIETDLKSEV